MSQLKLVHTHISKTGNQEQLDIFSKHIEEVAIAYLVSRGHEGNQIRFPFDYVKLEFIQSSSDDGIDVTAVLRF